MAIRVFEMADTPGDRPLLRVPYLATQTGTVGAASAAVANAFGALTKVVHVQSDEACHLVFGPSPTATTSGHKLAAGGEASFYVTSGDKVAWIQA